MKAEQWMCSVSRNERTDQIGSAVIKSPEEPIKSPEKPILHADRITLWIAHVQAYVDVTHVLQLFSVRQCANNALQQATTTSQSI